MESMATEDKLFGCPFCGFRVSPTEETCPRCGNKFNQDTRFECPFCGEMIGPEASECPTCHVNFVEFREKAKKRVSEESIDSLLMDIIKLESSQVKKEDKKLSCPNCSWLLDGTEVRCPKCGADFSQEATFQCPVCAEFVSANAAKCPECGTSFAGEAEAAEAERAEQKATADHEHVTSALTDILTSAGHTGPLPELEPEPVKEEPPARPAEPEPEPVKEETAPQPEEPVPEALAEVGKALEALSEPEPEPEVEPTPEAKAAAPTGPKKTKQRKLKAKPGGQKASRKA